MARTFKITKCVCGLIFFWIFFIVLGLNLYIFLQNRIPLTTSATSTAWLENIVTEETVGGYGGVATVTFMGVGKTGSWGICIWFADPEKFSGGGRGGGLCRITHSPSLFEPSVYIMSGAVNFTFLAQYYMYLSNEQQNVHYVGPVVKFCDAWTECSEDININVFLCS